jgi:hypothetical protein
MNRERCSRVRGVGLTLGRGGEGVDRALCQPKARNRPHHECCIGDGAVPAAIQGRLEWRRGPRTAANSGESSTARDSVEKARAWYDSPTYQQLVPIRQKTATSTLFIAEGVTR